MAIRGKGGVTRSDLILIGQAVKQRWLTGPLKSRAIATLRDGMDSDDERIRMRAAQILVAMESQNQQDEHKLVDVHLHARNARLASIAAELGIDEDIIRIAAAEADRDAGSDVDGSSEDGT